MGKYHVKKEILIKIGNRVLLDDLEWKVAEISKNNVTLYREGVSGDSHTIQTSLEKVEHLLFEQREY